MQFINFPPRKIGQKVVVQSALPESDNPGNNAVTDKSEYPGGKVPACRYSTKQIVSTSRNPTITSTSVEHAEDAKLAAGRSWPALKESKTFDSNRIAESPLFKEIGRLF